MSTPREILFVPGSLRKGSCTTALLRTAAGLLPEGYTASIVDLVTPLPYYDGDLEGDAAPPVVVDTRARVAASAAVVFATPEYNGSVPGGLKNLTDWLTRPPGAHSLLAKPVGLIGGSPSPKGASRALEWLGFVLPFLGAKLAGPGVSVPDILNVVSADGVVPEAVVAQLQELIDQVVALIED